MSKTQLLRRTVKGVIAGVVLFFVARYVRLHWNDLSAIAFSPRWVTLACAAVVLGIALCVMIVMWQVLLRRHGEVLALRKAFSFFFISQLGKYLPGKVWAFAGRVGYCVKEGHRPVQAFASVFYEQAFLVISAAIVGCLGGALLAQTNTKMPLAALVAAPVVIFLVAHPAAMRTAVNFGCRLLKREPIRVDMATSDYLVLLCWYVVFQLLAGLSFFLVAKAFAPLPWTLLPTFAGVYALAWVTGFLALLVPGGLGVREGVMLTLLAGVVAPEVAIATSIVHRLMITSMEVVGAGTGWVVLRREARGRQETWGKVNG